MRPLMYGYLRTDLAEHGGQVAEWVSAIKDFAVSEGFDLGMVFRDDAKRGGFEALLVELQRSESHHVVVPRMGHLYSAGQHPQALVARLSSECGAGVWTADRETSRIEVQRAKRTELRRLDGTQ